MSVYPWVQPIGVRPWEVAAAPIYPRKIRITRPVSPTPGGQVGYQGAVMAQETEIICDVPCTVQIQSSGRTDLGGALPDNSSKVTWTITVPTEFAQFLPLLMEEDRVYDDIGRRFMVNGWEPEPLGGRIDVVRLKA